MLDPEALKNIYPFTLHHTFLNPFKHMSIKYSFEWSLLLLYSILKISVIMYILILGHIVSSVVLLLIICLRYVSADLWSNI